MEKGQILELTIEDMSQEGKGIGKADGFAVFVDGAVVGDKVRVQLRKVKKRYGFGKLIEIIEESPDRVESFCEQRGECGGCPYGQRSYDAQLALKEKQVRDKLERLGGINDPVVYPIMAMDEPFRYRNKASMPVSTVGLITLKGGIVQPVHEPLVGFFGARSHEVADCCDCWLQSEPAMAAAEALRQFMTEDHITSYDPRWEKGLMRHMIVRTAAGTGEVMVILVINGKAIPNAQKLVEMLDEAIYNVPVYDDGPMAGVEFSLESVVINVNKSKNLEGPILGEECITIAGKPTITEEVGGMKFEISPLSFYQVNREQMVKLYDKVLEYADLKGIISDEATQWFRLHCPEKGAFLAYKKCVNDRMVQLLVPSDARRTSATLPSCRCDKAKVLTIKSFDFTENYDEAWSLVDENFVYRKGQWVEVKDFNEDRWQDSTTGIHFWLTREEAEAY